MDEETRRALSRIEAKVAPIDRMEQTLTRIESSQTDGRQEIDELISGVTRLARSIKNEAEDREERDGDAALRLKGINTFINETLPHLLKELPENVLKAVELKIYELRSERYAARLAGVQNDPAPLLPAPPLQRDPTGRVPLLPAAAGDRETGRVPRVELEPARDDDDSSLTPAQQRTLWNFVSRQWKQHGKWAKYPAAAGAWEGLRHLFDLIKHALHL